MGREYVAGVWPNVQMKSAVGQLALYPSISDALFSFLCLLSSRLSLFSSSLLAYAALGFLLSTLKKSLPIKCKDETEI